MRVVAQRGGVLLGGPLVDVSRRVGSLAGVDVDDGCVGTAQLFAMRERFSIDLFGESETVAAGFGEADEFFEPRGSSSFEMHADIEALDVRDGGGIDGELVAAGVDTELEIGGQAEVA
jgi:hypothetical protein